MSKMENFTPKSNADAQMSQMQAEGESYGERSGQEEGASQSVLVWMVCIPGTSMNFISFHVYSLELSAFVDPIFLGEGGPSMVQASIH